LIIWQKLVDEDLPKAQYALLMLRQARLSRRNAAAKMVQDLAHQTANSGTRTPEIEDANAAAWLAICALAKSLNTESFAPVELWQSALRATESWRELLT
jgi:hypothetical protein